MCLAINPQSQGHLTNHVNSVLTGAQKIVAHSRLIFMVEEVDTCTGKRPVARRNSCPKRKGARNMVERV